MINTITVKAELTLYFTEKGGRKTGINTLYRPNHVFEYLPNSNNFPTTYIGQIDFNEKSIFPGETKIVEVEFLKHQNIAELLNIGRVWWIHEGSRKIGEAKVLEIIKK